MQRVDKKYQVISRLLVISGLSLLIFAGIDWGVLIMIPALFLRKDWLDNDLNREFIAKNKMICYVISGYMALGSLKLLGLSLMNSIRYSKHDTANFTALSFAFFLPAVIYFAVFEYWLSKNK